jgi:ABC-type branched-subunit amino acid transport system permease subunit
VIILGDILSSWLAESWMMVLGGIFAAFILFSPGGVMALTRRIRTWMIKGGHHVHP